MLIKHRRMPLDMRISSVLEEGALVLDTTLNNLFLGDGVTPGGISTSAPVALKGPTTVVEGTVIEYEIVNSDKFATYTVQSSYGPIEVIDGKFLYTVPNLPEDTLLVFKNGVGSAYSISITPTGLQGVWSELSKGPSARRNSTLTRVGEDLYLFSGWGGTDFRSTVLNDLWKYTPSTDLWQLLEPTTAPPVRRHAMTAEMGGKLYVYGGISGGLTTSSPDRHDLWAYDPLENTWSDLTPDDYPAPRSSAVFEVIGGKLYLHGGSLTHQGGSHTDQLWRFDPSEGTWTLLSPNNPAPANTTHTGAVVDGKLYVHGNLMGDSLWVYDPEDGADGTWTELLPEGEAGGDLCVVDNKLYAVSYQTLYSYNFLTSQWDLEVTTSNPPVRHHYAIAAADSKVYLFGGYVSTRRIDDFWVCE